jgi:hypothetical protein
MNSIINLTQDRIPNSTVVVHTSGADFNVPVNNLILAPAKIITLPASAYDLTLDLSSYNNCIINFANGAGYTVNITLANPVVGNVYTIIFKQGASASTISITNTLKTVGSFTFGTSDNDIQKGTFVYDGVNWLAELSDIYA